VRAALEAALQMARDAGVKDPMLYIESEGSIHIMNRDHPKYVREDFSRAESVVGRLDHALPFGTDVGAW
jgi:hypothetical protein